MTRMLSARLRQRPSLSRWVQSSAMLSLFEPCSRFLNWAFPATAEGNPPGCDAPVLRDVHRKSFADEQVDGSRRTDRAKFVGLNENGYEGTLPWE